MESKRILFLLVLFILGNLSCSENRELIDEIAFMPGYFDPKWWSANNRVKKININFGRQDYIATFQNTMEIQTVKLPEQVNFKEITFTINEIYLSWNDNDTGISEIEFYNNGIKVEINVSRMN